MPAVLMAVVGVLQPGRAPSNVLLEIGLAGIVVLAAWLRKAGEEVSPAGAELPVTRVQAIPPMPTDAEAMRDRDVLVHACIEAYDATTSNALRAQLLAALAHAGVTPVEVPANTPFDPAQHKATDTLPTDQESLAGLIAETERPGFVDRGRRLRWPEVVVYQSSTRRASGD